MPDASPPASWHQRLRVAASALGEAAGPWLLVVLLGVAWLALSAIQLQKHEVDALQRQRLALTLASLQEDLEADLALGFDLLDDPNIASLLDRAIEHDPALRAVDVAGLAGITWHSTDRGAVGEALAPEVLSAAGAARAGTWSANVAGEPMLGTGLRGPFGEVVGYAVITYRPPVGRVFPAPLLVALALGGTALCGVLAASAWLGRRRASAPEAADVAYDHALQSLGVARQRFEHGLAQIDESERAA